MRHGEWPTSDLYCQSNTASRLVSKLGKGLLELSGDLLGCRCLELLRGVSGWRGTRCDTNGNADLLLVVDSIAGLALGLEDADNVLVLPAHLVGETGECAVLRIVLPGETSEEEATYTTSGLEANDAEGSGNDHALGLKVLRTDITANGKPRRGEADMKRVRGDHTFWKAGGIPSKILRRLRASVPRRVL